LLAEAILGALPARWQADTRVRVLAETASTNTDLRAAAAPSAGVEVLLAERQTAGRGRQGRAWASAPGNLALSLAVVLPGPLSACAGLALAIGVATAEALQAAGFAAVRLKWPNDLVAVRDDGLHKLGGLLVEADVLPGGRVRAVIGLGLNLRLPVALAERLDQPVIDLATLGPLPARNALVAHLVAHWREALAQFAAARLAPFVPRFEALHALAGAEVEVRGSVARWTGRVVGLADDGALRLRDDHGRLRAVHAGDVSLRVPCKAG
jgi:BirA family biotin operon repressor/biotin-[acetyl-CoA-carboxylase] ligase